MAAASERPGLKPGVITLIKDSVPTGFRPQDHAAEKTQQAVACSAQARCTQPHETLHNAGTFTADNALIA